jgi:AcrR family transcriptional regulator
MTRAGCIQTAHFQKLHPSRNGPSRAEVVSHQRERLCRAITTLAAEKDARRITVAELCALAGVSKRTFYEIFDDRQDCLIAAHERAVCRAAQAMARAPRIEGWAQESLQAALTALLAEAARRPAAARFALLDAIDATPAGLRRQRWAALQIEQQIAGHLEDSASAPVSPLALRAIVAGLSHVICTRLLDGRAAELPLLAPKLTEWAFACAALVTPVCLQEADELSGAPMGRADERCGPRARMIFRQRDERTLLMESALILVADGGMLRLIPEALATHSGVSKRRLHALFGEEDGAEQCLLEAIGHGGRLLLENAVAAGERREQWREALRAGVLALLGGMAAAPALTRALFVEAWSLGARAHCVRAELIGDAARSLRRAVLLGGPTSSVACETSVAAVWGLLGEQGPGGFGATRVHDLIAPVEALLLTPTLGDLACR